MSDDEYDPRIRQLRAMAVAMRDPQQLLEIAMRSKDREDFLANIVQWIGCERNEAETVADLPFVRLTSTHREEFEERLRDFGVVT